MPVTITHSTLADGTFSATGAAAWDATHTVSGLGTMAEQNSNNVNITGGSITGVTGVLSSLTVNSTPTSGGAAGQIMFDTGSVLQESSNLVWDNTNKKLTITGATVTTSQPVLDMTQTWNAAGVTFNAFSLVITDTASGGSSTLVDFKVGASSKFKIDKAGNVTNANTYTVVNDRIQISQTAIAQYTSSTVSWGSGSNFSAQDLFLTRRGAANLRLGAADAAAPVAQTLSVQSVVAGTSNTAGANLTITGSQGTGTGIGGSIIFRTAPPGTTGTAQNALVDALEISGDDRRLRLFGTILVFVNSGINSYFRAGNSEGIWTPAYYNTSTGYGLGSGFTTPDLFLTRRGAANLRFGAADAAAPVAQTLSVQSVVAGTSNTAGANLTITGSQGTGTGVGGSIIFQVAPAGSSGTAQNALSTALTISPAKSVVVNNAALATNATDGFLYVPTCAGTPTGTPTAQTGTAPIVVDTTNNKLYFYSGGAWRDAGP